MLPRSIFLALLSCALSAFAQSSAPPNASLDLWQKSVPPFSFTYAGKSSRDFLPAWQKSELPATPSEAGQVHHYVYTDPATQLRIAADVRTFTDFDAVEWVLHITNGGKTDSPILEDIQALDATFACSGTDVVLHSAYGSNQGESDFAPKDTVLSAGMPFLFGSDRGRSSDAGSSLGNNGSFPFFNLQTGRGGGIIGAIGWTGSWLAHFDRDRAGDSIRLRAGFLKTHLLLHPGETIRTARILLFNWKGGGRDASQNAWRRLILAHYSPKDPQGKVLAGPLCYCSGGNEPITSKMDLIRRLHENHIPADLYWIDAGWYGKDPNLNWPMQRGSWTPNKKFYPDGFKPLGDLLKQDNIGFLLWVEAETAMPGSDFYVRHPDWYIHPPIPVDDVNPYLLNLGNPAALKGITDHVSNLITDGEITWYRQDFNFYPDIYFSSADTPDRIGMTEIKHIEGLYAFWDALVARHPGLRIDNCASGGRRLDLETITRSYALHRSDYAGRNMGEQLHCLGLTPWVPLNDGILGASITDGTSSLQLYNFRSGYGAGGNYAIDPAAFKSPAAIDATRAGLEEFLEVRPYFYGDFYNLLPFSFLHDHWTAYQLEKPDHASGVMVFLRRDQSPYSSVQVAPRDIDPAASYRLEIRTTLAETAPREISGKDLAHFEATILDEPGSAIVFYNKL